MLLTQAAETPHLGGGAPRENMRNHPAQHFAFALGGQAPPGEKEA